MKQKYFISFLLGLFLASIFVLFSSCSVLKNKAQTKETETKTFNAIDTSKISINNSLLDTSKTNLFNSNSFQSLDIDKTTTTTKKDSTVINKDSTIIRVTTETTVTKESTHATKKDTTATKETTAGKTTNIVTAVKKGVQTDSGRQKQRETEVTEKKTYVFKYSWLMYLLIPVIAGILIYFKFIKK